jgi:hypothetical protein
MDIVFDTQDRIVIGLLFDLPQTFFSLLQVVAGPTYCNLLLDLLVLW